MIVLVNPQTVPSRKLLPVGVGYINAILKDSGFKTKIIDLNANPMSLSSAELKSEISQVNPSIVAISCIYAQVYPFARALCKISKEVDPNIKTVVGGVHANFVDVKALEETPELDIVGRGEGEYLMLELAQRLEDSSKSDISSVRGITYRDKNGKIKRNEDRGLICDPTRPRDSQLDCLPSPILTEAYDMTQYPHAMIFTLRGCPFRCIFCASGAFYNFTVRFHSVQRIVDEITHIVEHDKKNMIFFGDDTFTIDMKRTEQLLKQIIKLDLPVTFRCQSRCNLLTKKLLRLMRKANFAHMNMGLESDSKQLLKIMKKGITPQQIRRAIKWANDVGMPVSITFILGLPVQTQEQAHHTIKFVDALKGSSSGSHRMEVYPGTELQERAREWGMVYDEETCHTFKSTYLNDEEIEDLYRETYRVIHGLKNRWEEYGVMFSTLSQIAMGRRLSYMRAHELESEVMDQAVVSLVDF